MSDNQTMRADMDISCHSAESELPLKSKRSFVTVLNPAKEAVMGASSLSGSINLVGENTLGLRLGDRQVEASQQFSQGLVFSAYQHGQVVMSVVGRGSDTPGFMERAYSYLSCLDQLRDVGQVQRSACGMLFDDAFL